MPNKNNKSDIKNKIVSLLLAIDKLSYEYIDSKGGYDDNDKKSFEDHENRINAMKMSIEESKKEISQLKKDSEDLQILKQQLENNKKALLEAINHADNLLGHSIEILGIFVAIITIFIGGFSEISLFGTIDNLNTYKFFLYIIITGHIMANLIFMFIYMLGRITNKTISASCIGHIKIPIESSDSESKCQNCCYKSSETCIQYEMDKEHCTLARKLRYKYPYIYYTNLVSIVAEAFLCVGWLFSDEILTIKSVFWGKTSIIVIVAILAYMIVKKSLPKIKKFL